MIPPNTKQKVEARYLLHRLDVNCSISFPSMTSRFARIETEDSMERFLKKLRHTVNEYDFKKAKGSETLC